MVAQLTGMLQIILWAGPQDVYVPLVFLYLKEMLLFSGCRYQAFLNKLGLDKL